jgi:predicted sulfurtransferase
MKSRFVLKVKTKIRKILRYKARMVALRYDQEINPQLNFATVIKPNTGKMLIVLPQVGKHTSN